MALHECPGQTDEWYTPAHVFEALDCYFDVDVASPGRKVVPWIPTRRHITAHSLEMPWSGFVWMNPPFGGRNALLPWLRRFVEHGYGICLVPDRTSAPWWQTFAPQMDLILFVAPKLKFIGADGRPGTSPAQGTCLMAIGSMGEKALRSAAARGLGVLMQEAA